MSWIDTVTVAGFALTVFGIALTWREARKAATTAAAAKSAADQTQRQLQANQLLVFLPQLRWISTELENAVKNNDRGLTARVLHNWRWQAGHVHGILSAAKPEDQSLLTEIRESMGLAFAATTLLIDPARSSQSALRDCTRARGAIGNVCTNVASWVGKNAMTVNSPEEVSA